ncbi:peptide deformylase [Desulfofundulus thermobenzoicus]|uniref:Peptide deformylase n=1 Tax=Desulfofundulus thermobenzoicus TaxID=29376 RepID=A0A6N7IVP9_9FIRM|nr:peptide deformylase [Desulfofundulus thermobenzoicus]MQL53537.1 peptide deformylase [Desulfofundulus thermobenzoicus]HHW43752.1 peptide deformylase [Desulfotomaculum sp.]
MAIYKIVLYGDEVLREKARPVTRITPNILKLLDNMRDTMYDARGVGLAAPQVGVSKRVIVVDTGEGLIELINPEIVEARGEETDTEGCLSLPDMLGEVPRAVEVRVRGLDRHGRPVEHQASGFLARALQHEIDHLDGILFIDRALSIKRIRPGS